MMAKTCNIFFCAVIGLIGVTCMIVMAVGELFQVTFDSLLDDDGDGYDSY
jgi:hypothetical protein